MSYIQTCSEPWEQAILNNPNQAIDGVYSCPGLITNVDTAAFGAVWDSEVALIGFGGVISLWVVGLTVGLIISQIRKLRSL